MTVHLNGQPHQTSATTITALANELPHPPETLLIEHNGQALHRTEWPTMAITEGDRIELLKIAAGG